MNAVDHSSILRHSLSLAGETVELHAIFGHWDDYLELILPERQELVEIVRRGFACIAPEGPFGSLDIRFHQVSPPIISVLALYVGTPEHRSRPRRERLASILAELVRAVPALDCGELLPDRSLAAEAASADQPGPAIKNPEPANIHIESSTSYRHKHSSSPEIPCETMISEKLEQHGTNIHSGGSYSGHHEESLRGQRVSPVIPPDAGMISLDSVKELAKRGQLNKALHILEGILKLHPNNCDARKLMEALRLLERREKRRRREPYNAQTQLEVGFSYLLFERDGEAVEAFNKAAKINPHQYLHHLLLGIALHRQGKVEEARRAYWRAAQLRPKDNVYIDLLDALEKGEPPLPIAEASVGQQARRPASRDRISVQAI